MSYLIFVTHFFKNKVKFSNPWNFFLLFYGTVGERFCHCISILIIFIHFKYFRDNSFCFTFSFIFHAVFNFKILTFTFFIFIMKQNISVKCKSSDYSTKSSNQCFFQIVEQFPPLLPEQ